MLVSWRSVLFAASAIAAGVAACSSPFSTAVTSSSSTGTGAAGASSGSGASTGTTGSGAAAPCSKDADCVQPPADGQCAGVAQCTKGTCVTTYTLGQAKSQIYGDCQLVMCDPEGHLYTMSDSSDVYVDGNECTEDQCGDAGAFNPLKSGDCGPSGSGGKCVSLGPETPPFCGDCAQKADCIGLNETCQAGHCVPGHCGTGDIKLGEIDETDVDCGGECLPCAPGKKCILPKDCDSQLCTGVIGNKTCAAASCTDSVQNGKETDTDCGGGECQACPPTFKCLWPHDCASGVCKGNVCIAPSCTDGIKNGDETSADCGGSCPPCSP